MMHQMYCIAAILAVTLNSPLLCWGFPGFTMGDISINGNPGGITITGSGPENENGFYIVTNGKTGSDGKCIQNLEVHGNGFTDNFKTLCPTNGFTMLNTDVGTFYGGSNAPLTLYSYEPSSLVVIENGKCTKKVYTTTGEKTTSETKPVSDRQCKEVKLKIEEEEGKKKKFSDESNKTNFPSTTNENSKVTGNNKSEKKPKKSNSGSTYGNQNEFSTGPGKPVHGSQQGSISNFGNTYVYGGDKNSGDSISPGVSLSGTNHGSMSGFGNTYVYGDDNDSGGSISVGGPVHGSITGQGNIYVNGDENDFSMNSGGSFYGNQQGFSVSSNTYSQNGKCSQKVTVHGSHFTDTFKIPCSNKGMSMLNTDEVTIYGGSDSPFTLYSNEPSSLVIIENDKCTKKVYSTKGKKTTSVKKPVGDRECKEIKQKIAEEEEKNRKYWEEWEQNFNQQMNDAFPPCFPFCDESSSYTTNGNNKAAGNSKYGKKKRKKNKNKKNKKSKSKPVFPPCFPFCDDYDY